MDTTGYYRPLGWWLRHGRRDQVDPKMVITRLEMDHASNTVDTAALARFVADPDAESEDGGPVMLVRYENDYYAAREGTHRTLAARIAHRRVAALWVHAHEERTG